MRRSRRLNPRAALGIDLTAMVDVVFLLIIFFMVTTTFITAETSLPVDLPQAQSSQVQGGEMPTVTITRDGEIYLSGALTPEVALGQAVQNAMASSGMYTVVLRADQAVQHGLSVRVMDIIKQAGAQRIAIATGN